MLSLGRRPGEYLVINGNIFVKMVKERGDMKVYVDAPKEVSIVRGEVYEKTHERPKVFGK